MGALYQIAFPNGKRYIGMTVAHPDKRWKEHLYHSKNGVTKMMVHDAMLKHGIENARFSVLAIANDRKYLETIERNAIRVFGSRAPGGYNMTDGGDGAPLGNLFNVGKKRTAETRARMSNARKGRKFTLSPEQLAKRTASMLGNKYGCRTFTEEEKIVRQKSSRGKSHGASSGIVGVSFHKLTGLWRAHLTLNRKFIDLGYHRDIKDAAAARRAGEEKYFSER